MRLADIILLEYINYDTNKFMKKWSAEGKPYEDSIRPDGLLFTNWLESHDPLPKNKFVNWMIIRYLKNDIKRLEDIPARISPALKKYIGLQNKKKLKPEHTDINKITDIEDVMDEYGDENIESKRSGAKSFEKSLYDSGDAELVYNDTEYKIVIPKTFKALCFFGIHTKWCTTLKDDPSKFDQYSSRGPLYIILHKPSNRRWQFHFESNQYNDERDREIKIIEYFKNNKKVFGVFKKLGLVDYQKNQWRIGNRYYNDEMEYHREDGPAKILAGGGEEWYLNGKYHREDGPAIIRDDGSELWYLNGILHREDGPAITLENGNKEWWVDGIRHREDGPAIIYPDGTKEWWVDGIRHREDGPASIKSDGTKTWYKQGKLYRIDGPALELANGDKKWYVNNKHVTPQITKWAEENYINLDDPSPSEQQQITKFLKSFL